MGMIDASIEVDVLNGLYAVSFFILKGFLLVDHMFNHDSECFHQCMNFFKEKRRILLSGKGFDKKMLNLLFTQYMYLCFIMVY